MKIMLVSMSYYPMLPPKENAYSSKETKGKVGVREKAYGGGGILRWECFVDAFFGCTDISYRSVTYRLLNLSELNVSLHYLSV